ncbi:MAG: class I SAM-dependent methyltransferase, partial [Nanoarchaeota archaeon]
PQPTEKELEKIYSNKAKYSLSKEGLDKDNPFFNRRALFLSKHNKKKILDIGCSMGDFVYAAKKQGLSAEGIDLNKDSIKIGLVCMLELN